MQKYDNDSMRILKGADRVRLKPAVIFGADDITGTRQTLFEIISNSIDEAKIGYGNEIVIRKHKDLSWTIEDKGRGIPLDYNNKENCFNWQIALYELYGGGKYNNNTSVANYGEGIIGNNGLGLCASQYASEFMHVTSYRDGFKYSISFKHGVVCGAEGKELTKTKCEHETGTIIHYKPDIQVFTDIDISTDWLCEVIKQQAVVNKGLCFKVFDESTNQTFEFYYENGINDYIVELNNEKNFIQNIYFANKGEGKDREDRDSYKVSYEIIMSFNNEVNKQFFFHNSSPLIHGGSTLNAVKSALTFMIDRFAKDKYVKDEKRITFEDIENSLVLICNSTSTFTSYSNQTKTSITNKFIQDFVNTSLRNQLEAYFIENPEDTEKIVNQAIINKRSRERAEKTRIDIRKKLEATVSGLTKQIEGLKDCDMKKTTLEERELWLCEGLSACSTLTDARDDRTMGTYPLRGRFISALKNSVEDVLSNKPAMGIIQTLGCGIEIPVSERKKFKDIELFNIDKLRYGKIVIGCDADAFGHGITLSLITFFYKFMPTLLKQGRIYISVSPRYEIVCGDDLYFAYNDNDRDKVIKELEKKRKKTTIGIVKGLGQLDKEVFWEYVMNPEKRIIKQIQYADVNEDVIKKFIDTLMGEDIDGRKEFVKKNITMADINYID